VAEALFRAETRNDFFVRIEMHAESLEILGTHFAAQTRDAVRFAVAVVARIAGGLGQLVDDKVLGRIGRIAHAKIDDVVAGSPLVVEEGIDAAEQIRRQAGDALGDLNFEGLRRQRVL
jgi:hypothetical protein